MSKALDYVKAAPQIAFSLVVLVIILLNFRGLHLAVQKFLERAASMSAIKGFGIRSIWTQPELTARSPPRRNGRSSM
jgi:hypothetical protein